MAVVLLVVLVGLWWFPTPTSGDADSHSRAPRGKKFFHDLLAAEKLGPLRNLKQLIPAKDTTAVDAYGRVTGQTLLILGPARYPRPEEWKALKEWVEQGNTLIFAARLTRKNAAVDLHPFPVSLVTSIPFSGLGDLPWPGLGGGTTEDATATGDADKKVKDADKKVKDADKKDPLHKPKRVGSKDPGDRPWFQGGASSKKNKHLATITTVLADPTSVRWYTRASVKVERGTPGAQVLVNAKRGAQAVRLTIGDGCLVVVASDEVFTNQSLVRKGEAWLLAWRLFEQRKGKGAVFIDEYLNHTGTPKTVGLLFDPMFRPITMQILLCAVLFGWLGSRRFGAPKPPAIRPRRSIVEHAEALGNLQYRAEAGGHAVTAYLEWWRHELHLQGGYQKQADLIARLAYLSKRDPAVIAQLLHDAARVAHAPIPAARATVMIRELSRLRQLLTRSAEK